MADDYNVQSWIQWAEAPFPTIETLSPSQAGAIQRALSHLEISEQVRATLTFVLLTWPRVDRDY